MPKPTCQDCESMAPRNCVLCPSNPENKPYTPEDAVRAMLDGKELWDKNGSVFYWDKCLLGFQRKYPKTGKTFPVVSFFGLFEKL